jgi:hypothetical protein
LKEKASHCWTLNRILLQSTWALTWNIKLKLVGRKFLIPLRNYFYPNSFHPHHTHTQTKKKLWEINSLTATYTHMRITLFILNFNLQTRNKKHGTMNVCVNLNYMKIRQALKLVLKMCLLQDVMPKGIKFMQIEFILFIFTLRQTCVFLYVWEYRKNHVCLCKWATWIKRECQKVEWRNLQLFNFFWLFSTWHKMKTLSVMIVFQVKWKSVSFYWKCIIILGQLYSWLLV